MFKIKTVFFIFLIIICFKVTAEERQVHMDKEGKIFTISRETAKELDLFIEYSHFKEAILFQISDNEFILEITEEIDGKLVRHRKPYTHKQVMELREKISDILSRKKTPSLLDHSGRFPLLVGTFFLSYGFYGFSIPIILDIDEFAINTGIYFITSGAGFFIPFFLTRNAQVTRGQAALAVGAGCFGIPHGIFLNFLIFGNSFESTIQTLMAISTGTSIGEGIIGYFLADKWDLSGGEGSLITLMGMIGIGQGIGLATLIHGDDVFLNSRIFAAEALGVSAAGLVLGKVMIDHINYTTGDTLITTNCMFLGLQLAASVILITDQFDSRFMAGSFMTGTAASIALSTILIGKKDFQNDHGNLITLATLGGSLIGMGIGWIINPNLSTETDWLITTLGFTGGAIGFGSLFALFKDSAFTDSKEAEANAFSISLHPESIILSKFVPCNTTIEQIKMNTPLVTLRFSY